MTIKKFMYKFMYTFLKELMLIRLTNQKGVISATIGISYIKGLIFNQMSAMGVMKY